MPNLSAEQLRAAAVDLLMHGRAIGGSAERECEKDARDLEMAADEVESEILMMRNQRFPNPQTILEISRRSPLTP